ncbi:MAG: hypothetical protein DME92_11225, partial [Verrucomicrobia bacterium]
VISLICSHRPMAGSPLGCSSQPASDGPQGRGYSGHSCASKALIREMSSVLGEDAEIDIKAIA